MGKIYCPNCGHKNEYTLKKPTHCSSCGKPLTMGQFSKTTTSSKERSVRREIQEVEIDEDESDSSYVPEIRKLQYDIEYSNAKVFKGGDILNISESDLNQNKTSRGTKKRKTNLRRKQRDS